MRRICNRTFAFALPMTAAAFLSASSTTFAQQWPSFRGPDGSGVAPASAAPPVSFDATASRNVAWRTSIPGLAHSSPIVWNDRIFVTTAVAESGTPAVKTGDVDRAGIDSATDTGMHTWRLIAVDRTTGAIVWDRAVHRGVPRMKRHVKASHASATPATDGRLIVALLGSEGLFCFDMSGTLRWKQDLGVMDVGLVDDPSYQWGPASSPIIFENLVIVQNDRHKDSVLAAYDLQSGKRVWRTSRDELPSWATPFVYGRGSDRPQLVTNSGKFIRGSDPRTGRELWSLTDRATQVKVPTPIGAGESIIVTGGYPPGGRPVYAIRPGLSGEVTEAAALAWKAERGSPYTTTPVAYDGILYVCTDNGILSAYDIKTGQRIYQQRISGAGGFSASPIVAAGRLYLTSEEGDVFVVRAGRQFDLLATNKLGEVTMATPAVAGPMLIVRTRSALIGLREGGRTSK